MATETDATVRGHTCPGLERFQDQRSSCTPTFGLNGEMRACDGTNYVVIAFCPFCGERLAPVKAVDWPDLIDGETGAVIRKLGWSPEDDDD